MDVPVAVDVNPARTSLEQPRRSCSSGKRTQHRLTDSGDGQLNHALHIIVTRALHDPSVLMRDRFSTVDLVKFIGWLDDAFVDDVFAEMNAPVLTTRIATTRCICASSSGYRRLRPRPKYSVETV